MRRFIQNTFSKIYDMYDGFILKVDKRLAENLCKEYAMSITTAATKHHTLGIGDTPVAHCKWAGKPEVVEYLPGRHKFEAFAKLEAAGRVYWRFREFGVTEDFETDAFDSMQEFFQFTTNEPPDVYWGLVLKAKAQEEGDD